MAAHIVYDLDPLPDGRQWCVLCARLAKGDMLGSKLVQAQMSDANALPDGTVVHIKAPRTLRPLELAITTTIVAMPVMVEVGPGQLAQQVIAGPVPVCFTHLQGITESVSGVMAFPAAALPHERGAVDLSTRRRG